MIVDSLVSVINAILGAFPSFTAPTGGWTDGLHILGGAAKALSPWVNVSALFGVLALIGTLFLTVLTVRVVLWVWELLPFT